MAQALVNLSEGIASEPAPLEFTTDGVIRIGKTRVTLDTVIAVFKQGTTAEEIAYRYPSLKLADIYATLPSTSIINKKWKCIYSKDSNKHRKFAG